MVHAVPSKELIEAVAMFGIATTSEGPSERRNEQPQLDSDPALLILLEAPEYALTSLGQ
jgi:hypothetical protein